MATELKDMIAEAANQIEDIPASPVANPRLAADRDARIVTY